MWNREILSFPNVIQSRNMKHNAPYLILCLLVGFMACSKDEADNNSNATVPSKSEIALLKIDKDTYDFLGGRTYEFPVSILPGDSVPLLKTYQAPADYGSLTIHYRTEAFPIFSGTIIWIGTGSVSIPDSIFEPDSFSQTPESAAIPDTSQFQVIHKFIWNEVPDYAQIWAAIDHLEIVHEYLEGGKKVSLFEYTASAGGDPQDVYWYVVFNK